MHTMKIICLLLLAVQRVLCKAKLPGSKYDLRYIQAWLNHPYTEKLFQIMGSDFEGGFTARGTYLLKKIPFVELDLDDEKQKRYMNQCLFQQRK